MSPLPNVAERKNRGTYALLYREMCNEGFFRENPRIRLRKLEEYIQSLNPPEGLNFEGRGMRGIIKKLQLLGYASDFDGGRFTLIFPN